MDTSRERAMGAGGATIRLRYSRQFESGGHAHTIDAEIALPVGANLETRDQVIRELEGGVEQLARQITLRQSRAQETQRTQSQAAGRPASPPPGNYRSSTPEEPAQAASQRTPRSGTRPLNGVQTPAPTSNSGEGKTISLKEFTNAIKKHLHLEPEEAARLLKVDSLEGLQYREAYNQLQALLRQNEAEYKIRPNEREQQPLRSEERHTPPYGRITQNLALDNGQHAEEDEAEALYRTTRPLPDPGEGASTKEETLQALARMMASVQSTTPAQPARRSYRFEEEDDEEELLRNEQAKEEAPASAEGRAQTKIDELKNARGNNLASAERLTVLNNLVDGQISEQELQLLMQKIWGISSQKKLKGAQAEALISWAKEDFFEDEVKAVLTLFEQKESEE